jgi:radical SAM superfamily enzyme YgiQ (UPF0313 family)
MKFTFVLPDMSWLWDYKNQFPLGILYLSTQIKGMHEEVDLFDTNCKNIDDIPYADVFAFSVVHATYYGSINLAKKIKAKFPNSQIIVGGVHPTTSPDIDPIFDSVFVGQSELTMLDYIVDLKNGCPKKRYVQSVPFKTLDDFYPDRSLLPDDYLRTASIFTKGKAYSEGGSTSIMFSRGCPYRCSFCASPVTYGGRVLFRSVSAIEKEIRHIINTYGIRQFRVQDDTLTYNKKFLKELHAALKPLDIYYRCSTRVNTVDHETIERLYESGCREIGLGVEVADNDSLKILNKKITVDQIEQAIAIIKKFPIIIRGFFMIGLPFDSVKTVQANIDFIERNELDNVVVGRFYPFPGCEMNTNKGKYNIAEIKKESCLSIAQHLPLVPNIIRTDITEQEHIGIMKIFFDYLVNKGFL